MGGALASSPMFSFLAESIVGARRDAVDDYADAVDAGHESTASLRSFSIFHSCAQWLFTKDMFACLCDLSEVSKTYQMSRLLMQRQRDSN